MISITIPVYNEEENLYLLHESITSAMSNLKQIYEIIYVNDGSTDNSKNILDELSEGKDNIKVIHFKRNYGQTAAMMAGFDYAEGDIVIPMDADLQNDPKDIIKLLEKIDEGYDVVSGWRKDRQDNAIKRNLPSKMANLLISKISGVRLNDYGCTLKAYKKSFIEDVKLYGEMHRFIPIYASWEGAKIAEVPVSHHARRFGVSKYGLNRIFKVLLDLLVVKFLEKYAKKPIHFFGGVGFLFLFLSFGTILYAIGLKLGTDLSLIRTPLPVMASMFFTTGIVSILLGLLAEMQSRIYHESQQKSIYSVSYTKNCNK